MTLQFKNCMEDFVIDRFDEITKQIPLRCDCDICKTDIILLALNNLKPRYVSTERGDMYTRLDLYERENNLDIMCEVAKAIKLVGENPRHG